MSDKEVANPEWYKLTGKGLQISGRPSWDEYEEEFIKWAAIHRASAFAIGDLLVYGERRWGETYAQVSAVTTLAPEYLYNVKYVCEKVPFNRRHENLSFSHHQAVASIKEPKEQTKWLAAANMYDMTRDELRKEISKGISAHDYVSLRLEDGEVPEQVVIDPPGLDLHDIVVVYIRARRDGDPIAEEEAYEKMKGLVKEHL